MQTGTPQSGYSDIIWWNHYMQWYNVGGVSAVLLTLATCWLVYTMWPPTLGDCYHRLHFSRHTSHMCNLGHLHLNSTNSKSDRLSDFCKSSHVHLCHLRLHISQVCSYICSLPKLTVESCGEVKTTIIWTLLAECTVAEEVNMRCHSERSCTVHCFSQIWLLLEVHSSLLKACNLNVVSEDYCKSLVNWNSCLAR